ncbi:DUF1878 family protein [Sutcliffiella deserti]|uniref:DUF1878 family protein n=1 Tax=Sutcliffiella deserti TaxID=2875501 RepID=UPI001CBF01E8|nr:DUF1878 family protein [Sutcliffiella deserti]
MADLEKRMEKLEFQMELLLKQIKVDQFPFDALVIKGNLSREDVTNIMNLCEDLTIEMEKQKAEGFVTFTPLLAMFEKRLHPHMPLEDTILALKKQGIYQSLMCAFLKLLIKK